MLPKQNRRTLNLKFALVALAWMAFIFVFSAQSKNDIPAFGAWDFLIKKSGHMLEYAVLAWLWHRALGGHKVWAAWGLAVLYAATDEFHQAFTPGRHAQLADVGIDALGAAIGLCGAIYFGRRLKLVFRILVRQITAILDH